MNDKNPFGSGRFVAGALPEFTKASKKKKSFLEDNISTGGSIAGALAGGASGAAIGSVVPVVGTAVGGIIGALLGGAAGGGGGQMLENKLTGEDDLMAGVGEEALWGGATALPIGALGKLAKAGGTVAKGMGSEAAKTAAKGLVQEAGIKTVGKKTLSDMLLKGNVDDSMRAALGASAKMPALTGELIGAGANGLKTTIPGKLQASADKALLSQYGPISKPTIRSTNPTKTVSELASYGVVKPADAERLAGAITGSNGLLTKKVSEAVGKSGGVDTSTLRRVFNDALDNNGIVDADRKSLTAIFEAQMKRLTGGAAGSLSSKANPTEALGVMKSLEKKIADYMGKGGTAHLATSTDKAKSGVLSLVRDELEDALYRGAGANSNIKSLMTPKFREQLVSLMPNNPKWASYVDSQIMNAADVGAIRSAQRPFVNISKIIDEAADNSISVGGRAVTNMGGVKDTIATALANAVRNPLARTYSKGVETALGKQQLLPGALTRALPQAVGGDLPRQALGMAARQTVARPLLAGGMVAGVPQDDIMAGQQDAMAQQSSDSIAGIEQAQTQNPLGYSSLEIAQALMKAYAAGDKAAIGQLQGMYELASAFEESSAGGADLTSQQATAVGKASTALSALDRLEQLYQSSGGGGRVGGSVAGIMGALGANANAKAYNDQLASVARFMGRAMGETGAGSDADAQAFISRLPQLTDTPEEARIKLQELRAMLQDSRANVMYYGGGGDPAQAAAY